jgi:hypothetical protein
MEENGLKIFKIPFFWNLTNCRHKKKNPTTVDSLVNFQKKIPQQSIYRQKSTVDFKACTS